ncbi:hypothetical protein K9M50_02045, partial [Patescibacteria group bacterium]|nr:hypothetical protein [Patescibacteria group bacterium]
MTKTIKTILLLIIIIFSFQVFIPNTLAQDDPPESLDFSPQIPIPGSEFDGNPIPVGESDIGEDEETGRQVTTMYSTLLPRYIKAIYNYGIGIAAFLALAMIVGGGVIWLTSGGSSDKISTARSMIVSSIIGLVLLLGTYTLLQIVSPALLSFDPIETEYIGALKFGCCEIERQDNVGHIVTEKAQNMTNKDCEKAGNMDSVSSVFNKGFSADSDGTQCLKDGCCILTMRRPVSTGQSVTWIESTNCIKTNVKNCQMIKENDPDTKKYDWQDLSCTEVTNPECNAVDCKGVSNGKKCPG